MLQIVVQTSNIVEKLNTLRSFKLAVILSQSIVAI